MKEQTKKAVFELENYKVIKFSFFEPTEEQAKLGIQFNPSGVYYKAEGKYVLTFEFSASFNEGKEEFINTIFQGVFKFEPNTELENIPSYFYRNSIAIIFPYVRSFVTTLTAIGNIKPLILPVLNLSGLEEPLKTATISQD